MSEKLSLGESGAIAFDQNTFDQNIFERRQSAYRALGMHWLADVREIRRGYQVSLRELCGTRLVVFEGASCRDSVAVQVTGDSDDPFSCVHLGPDVHLPNVSFELAAQLWLAAQEGVAKETKTVTETKETVTEAKTNVKDKLLSFDNEEMQQMATVQLVDESGNPTEALTVPSFSTFQADEARGYEKITGGSLYTWKSVGDKNWLVAGRADVVDVFGFVVLPDYRGEYLDLMDDDMDDDEDYDNSDDNEL